MKLPTIALVGHPNVGKSTIFNRLVGQKLSIIEDTPGVTRDRIYSEANYKDYKFNIEQVPAEQAAAKMQAADKMLHKFLYVQELWL